MPKILLPLNYNQKIALRHEPTGRETLLIIPGASQMDRTELVETIQCAEERFAEQSKAEGPKPIRKYTRQEVGKALNEFRNYFQKRQKNHTGKLYF